jgi:hypothetical protein
MKVTARYKLVKSCKLNGKGLVVLGDLIDGDAKAGDFITFHTGYEEVTRRSLKSKWQIPCQTGNIGWT